MKEFEIYFSDLNKKAQKELLKRFNTTEEDENWDTFPIAIIPRDDEVE